MTAHAIQKTIEAVADKIAREFHPEKIILFGSYAWGKPGPDSDVDLLIIKSTDDTRKTAREIDGAIFPRPFSLDIIVYDPRQVARRRDAGDFWMNDILSKGKVLYAR
ncbi:MAG: nucleotidyltransferase domain-containing protein [Nitrospirota bacterium]